MADQDVLEQITEALDRALERQSTDPGDVLILGGVRVARRLAHAALDATREGRTEDAQRTLAALDHVVRDTWPAGSVLGDELLTGLDQLRAA